MDQLIQMIKQRELSDASNGFEDRLAAVMQDVEILQTDIRKNQIRTDQAV